MVRTMFVLTVIVNAKRAASIDQEFGVLFIVTGACENTKSTFLSYLFVIY